MRSALAACLFLATLALGAFAYRAFYQGGETYELCHYSELAANLLSGRGYRTSTYYPCTLAYLGSRGVKVEGAGPVVDRFPLQAGLVASMQLAFGRSDAAAVAANVLAHAAWAALALLVGLRFFSPGVAAGAALLLAFNPMLLAGYDLRGYPDVLFGFLLLALNALFFDALVRRGAGRALAAGVLAGLCYLSRYSFALFLPVYLSAPLWSREARGRRREAGLFLAGFAALAIPWSAYNASILGAASPPLLVWNLAQDTIGGVLPWADYRVYHASDFLHAAALSALGWKWLAYFLQFLHDVPGFWFSLPLFPFAILGLWRLPESAGRAFARFYAGLLLWAAFFFSFLRYEQLGFMNGRYYLWFAPALYWSALAFIERLGERLSARGAKAAAPAAAALTLAGWAFLLPHFPRRGARVPVGERPEIMRLKALAPSGWVVTNLPTQLTWYAGLKTITLPNLPPAVGRIQRDYDVDYVYLSFDRVGEWMNYPAWRALAGGYAGGIPRFCAELGYEVAASDEAGVLLKRKR